MAEKVYQEVLFVGFTNGSVVCVQGAAHKRQPDAQKAAEQKAQYISALCECELYRADPSGAMVATGQKGKHILAMLGMREMAGNIAEVGLKDGKPAPRIELVEKPKDILIP